MLNTVMGSVPSKSKIVHNLQPQTMVKRPLEFYGTEVGASNEQSFSRCPPVGSELNAKTVHGSSNLYRQGSFRKSLIPASAPFGQVSKYFSPNSSGMKPIRKSDVVNISDDDADSVEVNLPSKEVKVHFSKPLLHPTDRVVFKIALFWLANALVSRNGNAAFTKESITIQKQNNEIFTYRGPSISGKPMVLEIGTVQISETKKHVLICFHGKSSLRVEEIAVLFHEEQEFHHVQSLLNPIFTLVQVSDDKLAKFVRESEKFLTSTQRTRYSKIHNDDSSEEFRPTDSATVKEGDWQERRKSRRISQHAVKTSGFYQEKQSSTQIESPPTIPRPNTNNELFQYPPNDRFSVSIKEHDEHRLNEGEFLNDTIIEFYLR